MAIVPGADGVDAVDAVVLTVDDGGFASAAAAAAAATEVPLRRRPPVTAVAPLLGGRRLPMAEEALLCGRVPSLSAGKLVGAPIARGLPLSEGLPLMGAPIRRGGAPAAACTRFRLGPTSGARLPAEAAPGRYILKHQGHPSTWHPGPGPEC